MTTFKVDSGVPIPAKGDRGAGGIAEVLKNAAPGQSVGNLTEKQKKNAQVAAHFHGFKVLTRREPDGTYRVWRTE